MRRSPDSPRSSHSEGTGRFSPRMTHDGKLISIRREWEEYERRKAVETRRLASAEAYRQAYEHIKLSSKEVQAVEQEPNDTDPVRAPNQVNQAKVPVPREKK
ncbi:hypothetical protein TKK_0003552 [Trichogramma kaykai]